MMLVLVLAFAFLALSIAGQRLVARLLGVKGQVRPLLPFAEGTSPLHQLAVRLGGAVSTWLLLFAMCFGVMAREQRYPPIVEVVPGFPAATAGMQTGDRVVQVDGQPVR
ncbi:MAG: PDZ domain-containing protein, partial [Archangium sp.]|nr:PDZ domain-containing protein [Archangium sp.]